MDNPFTNPFMIDDPPSQTYEFNIMLMSLPCFIMYRVRDDHVYQKPQCNDHFYRNPCFSPMRSNISKMLDFICLCVTINHKATRERSSVPKLKKKTQLILWSEYLKFSHSQQHLVGT